MRAVDEHIPAPQRSIEQPFAMPIEGVFAIQVRQSDRGLHICLLCLRM